MKTILIPTNFTDVARHATDYAIKLYGGHLEKIILLNAFDQPKVGRTMPLSLIDIMRKNSEKGLVEDQLRIKETFPELNCEIEINPALGGLSSSIKSIISNGNVDLIVMGSSGDREFMDMFIESVTAKVINNVDHPMLIVPPVADFKRVSGIIMTTDFKQITSAEILTELRSLCQITDSKVHVLNVSKTTPKPSSVNEQRVSSLLEGIDHEYYYKKNSDIPSGIYKFIKDTDADIVTLIKRKGAGSLVARMFHRSISKRIVNNIRQTLLLLCDQDYST